MPLLAPKILWLGLLILRHMPDRLHNLLEAVRGGKVSKNNNRKRLYCWGARLINNTMVTKCPELFRCCLGDKVYSSKLHGTTIKAVYPLKTLKYVMEKYSELIASVLGTSSC